MQLKVIGFKTRNGIKMTVLGKIEHDPRFVPRLNRYLNLVKNTYSEEYDLVGIVNPVSGRLVAKQYMED